MELSDCLVVGRDTYNICSKCDNGKMNRDAKEVADYFNKSYVTIPFVAKTDKIARIAKLVNNTKSAKKAEIIKPRKAYKYKRNKYVYFIGEGKNKPVKIGISMNPQDRLRALQTSNPEPLNILGMFYGWIKEESMLHEKYADYRLNGEWFSWNDGIENEINQLCLSVANH